MGTFRYFASLGLAAAAVLIAGIVTAVVAWVEGIIMIFHASIVLGIISLFLEVPYFVESVVYYFTGYDIAMHIACCFGLS